MYPRIEFSGTDLALQSHDVMVGLAAVVAAALGAFWVIRDQHLHASPVVAALLAIATTTLIGGRLHFVVANWSSLHSPLASLLRFSSGSLHAPGAILGAVLGTVLVLRRLDLPLARFADSLAPAVGIGIAIARLGCFLHGCCYGIPCDLPWAVTLSSSSYVYAVHLERGVLAADATHSLPVHPLPLYFAACGAGIAAFLLWLRPRKSYDGQLALTLLFLFSASSALLEPLRIDDPSRIYWGPWPQLLWVNSAMTVVSAAALLLARQRAARATIGSPSLHDRDRRR